MNIDLTTRHSRDLDLADYPVDLGRKSPTKHGTKVARDMARHGTTCQRTLSKCCGLDVGTQDV